MVVKIEYAQATMGQRPKKSIRKSHWPVLHRPTFKLLHNAGAPILAFVAVFSGLTGSPEDLEKMGIHRGPTHL